MGEDELPRRNLRFPYGGNFKEIGKVPSMLYMYSGGETVDCCDWNGDEVCLLDLVKEVKKLVSIPECCKVKLWWFWLSRKDGCYCSICTKEKTSLTTLTFIEKVSWLQYTYVNPFDDPEVNSWYAEADDEVDRNQGKGDFNISQGDSNNDEDYVVSDFEWDIGVLNQKYEVSTRSKGSPLIDVNRIDAAEDYESPHSATDSETDDDVYCDDDLTQE
ncbi:hypothetical protein FRX31_032949 [Thalictrum thalictroides]|uniref:Uncharacterized protein n=1 Tax=Thalictrum thalictroides TaxID=46969 RepID=A0A7J6UZI3_THATH|nr:hypothetical protein FRX31_032949 [Thalictrum thalictroides]